MRTSAAIAVGLLLTAGWLSAQSATAVRATANADGTVDVRVSAPAAGRVSVRVDTMPPGAAVALANDGRGVWTGRIGPLPPDFYPMQYMIDGFAGFASYVHVTGAAPEAWDMRAVPHGQIHRLWYDSRTMRVPRSVVVYTPPGYSSATAKYPVLYLLHGSGGTELSWVDEGVANVILDNLIADKKAVPMLVVMPFGHSEASARAGAEPTFAARDHAKFSEELRDEIMPMIDREFRTQSGPDRRAITGFSMGGTQARSIGLTHLETFHYIGAFSAGLAQGASPAQLEEQLAGLLADPASTSSQLRLLWFGAGTEEAGVLADTRMLVDVLARHDIRSTFVAVPGGHTMHVWRRNLRDFVQLIFR